MDLRSVMDAANPGAGRGAQALAAGALRIQFSRGTMASSLLMRCRAGRRQVARAPRSPASSHGRLSSSGGLWPLQRDKHEARSCSTHVHTHTYTNINTLHTNMHTHTHSHMQTCINTPNTRTRYRAHTYTCTSAFTSIYTHLHACGFTLVHTCVHRYGPHVCAHMYPHAPMCPDPKNPLGPVKRVLHPERWTALQPR